MPSAPGPYHGQDPSGPVDIGCGTLMPVRSSRFTSILEYTYDSECAPSGAEDKPFEFHCIVVTTRGHWQFHGAKGREDIDAGSLTVGIAGDTYGCRHYRRAGADSNVIIALRAGAIDPDCRPLFHEQVVPARRALRVVRNAAQSEGDDRFDSLIFALFDDVSKTSLRQSEVSARLRMQRAKRFIELHAFEQIHLADLACELGLSPFTTVRQFRIATGMTPYAYLLKLRLDRAKELLRKGNDPIGSVAQKVGFFDLAHFSKFFRRSTGRSPSTFRTSSR